MSALVRIKGAKHILAEPLRITGGEEHLVHVDEHGEGEFAVGTVHEESLVPLPDVLFVVAGVTQQEGNVLGGQFLLAGGAAAGPHDLSLYFLTTIGHVINQSVILFTIYYY